MTPRFIWSLVPLNAVAFGVAVLMYALLRHGQFATPENFEARLQDRISTVADATQMRASGAELVGLFHSYGELLRSHQRIIDWCFAFIAAMAVINLVFIACGIREFRNRPRVGINVR